MKQLLMALVVTFAFGTAFAQSATPDAVDAPGAPATSTPADTVPADTAVAAEAPAEEDDDDAAAVPPQAAEVPTVAVPNVTPNISHTVMGVGAAALVAIALSAGGGSDDDDKGGCHSDSHDCPSSP